MTANSRTVRTLQLTAGYIFMTLGGAHTFVFLVLAARHGYPLTWAAGELRGTSFAITFATTPSQALFWGSIGSAAIPLLLLGTWINTNARNNTAIPAFLGHTLAMYCALAAIILEPSGFPIAFVAALLLIAAQRLASCTGQTEARLWSAPISDE